MDRVSQGVVRHVFVAQLEVADVAAERGRQTDDRRRLTRARRPVKQVRTTIRNAVTQVKCLGRRREKLGEVVDDFRFGCRGQDDGFERTDGSAAVQVPVAMTQVPPVDRKSARIRLLRFLDELLAPGANGVETALGDRAENDDRSQLIDAAVGAARRAHCAVPHLERLNVKEPEPRGDLRPPLRRLPVLFLLVLLVPQLHLERSHLRLFADSS
mmetsp:Transcript_341/g.1042  ORF Transcript_341/g.1042 Transcript_341/m.1042 type:complete len:213 (-) Transcript_341:151-789(-)